MDKKDDIDTFSKCDICKQVISRKDNFNRHKKHCTAEKEKELFECEKCNVTFSRGDNYRRHIKAGCRRHSCPKCAKVFTSKKERDAHTMNEHVSYKCRVCLKHFLSRNSYYHHIKKCKKSKCIKCNQAFNDRDIRKMHEDVCDGRNVVNYNMKCEKCGKVLKKNSWKKHKSACEKKEHKCAKCNLIFTSKRFYDKHLKIHLIKEKEQKKMGQQKETYACVSCGEMFNSLSDLKKHEGVTKHNEPSSSRQIYDDVTSPCSKHYHCKHCNLTFENLKLLYEHRAFNHQKGYGDSLQQDPWEKDKSDAPWMENGEVGDSKLKKVYDMHRPIILQPHDESGAVQHVYNFPIKNNVNINNIREQIEEIYQRTNHAFKINLSFGTILINIDNGEYRYFKAYDNAEQVLPQPYRTSKTSNIDTLIERISRLDIIEKATQTRPDTKWKAYLLTNIRYSVTLLDFPLGLGAVLLPKYLKDLKSVKGMDKSANHSNYYEDDMCLFRCYAYHRGADLKSLETPVKLYFEEWKKSMDLGIKKKDFRGVKFEELPLFEKLFKVNINIFRLNEEKIALPVYKSRCRFIFNGKLDEMNLNIYEGHLSYISSIDQYSSKFECRSCEKLFKRKWDCHRHERTCNESTYYQYPGGFFKQTKTLFEKIEEYGITIPNDKRQFPWFITFDMESILESISDTNINTDKLIYVNRHIPVSASVASDISEFKDPKCFISKDPDNLVFQMVEYMLKIQNNASLNMRERFKSEINQLRTLRDMWIPSEEISSELSNENDSAEYSDSESMETNHCEGPSREFTQALQKENAFKIFLENMENGEWLMNYNGYTSEEMGDSAESDEDSDSIDGCRINKRKPQDKDLCSDLQESISREHRIRVIMHNQLNNLLIELESYCDQIPVLGFNSGKYDINLIRSKLIKHLGIVHDKTAFIIKKNNSYLSIANSQFKFLDITNYLPAGTSYSQFLKTFKVQESKFFFPYEFLNSYEKLDYTSLPDIESFYSSLKKCNVLEAERQEYESLLLKFKNKREVLDVMKLEKPPNTKEENYEFCKKVWEENDMQNFSDYLSYYNNKDVGPFVHAVSNLQSFYYEKGIDVFKETLSVPGVARKMIFEVGKKNNASFALIDRSNKDLHEKIKSNIIGGPSIVFNRYAKVGETPIKNDESNICQNIIGFDANALYLWAIGQDMPVGAFNRRKKRTGFKPEKRDSYLKMYDWMEWKNFSENVQINHKVNTGVEKRIGPYLADGFDSLTNTVYEFYGCYFHGHLCKNTKHVRNEKWFFEQPQRLDDVRLRKEYIISQGHNVEEVWECEYDLQMQNNKDIRDFNSTRAPKFLKKFPGRVKEEQIIKEIKNDTLFGMVEVNIETPDDWPDALKNNFEVGPAEYFSEMAPLFCNVNVPFEKIGKHMQEHVQENGLSKKPRRLLISGNKGNNLLLATPLLKWYLEHGLIITKIHEVIEFSRQNCFKDFTDSVTCARRQGDCDSDLEVLATTMKLIGNSGYGSLIMDKKKHQKLHYSDNMCDAQIKVNDRKFRRLEELEEGELFE